MSVFNWPMKDEEYFNEARGEFQVRQVPDIPQVTEHVFLELKGVYADVTRDLTDEEIVEKGLQPGAKKKVAKKKAKKKVAKK